MKKLRYLVIALVLIVDYVLKAYIRETMYAGQSFPVIKGIFSITYVQNRGAAFSIMEGQEMLLTLLPAAALVIAVIYMEKLRHEHWTMLLALQLIIAGGAGNLIDRVARGFVTDMFDFHFWPVFNIADIAIVTGCGFLILFMFKFDESAKKEKEEPADEA